MTALRSFIIAVLAGFVLVACRAEPAEQRGTDQVLIGSGEAVSDTLASHLRVLQRDLLRALVSTDTSKLGRLLSAHFVIHDTGTPESIPVSLEAGPRPEQITYLQILSGGLGRRVDADYQTFHVGHDGAQATTYAIAQETAVRTAWRRRGSHWEATQLILMSAEAARRMIDGAHSGRRVREDSMPVR